MQHSSASTSTMTSNAEWKSSLSSIDRYEVIQRISSSLSSQDMKEAIAMEQAAYSNSSSREEYDAACEVIPRDAPQTSAALVPEVTLSAPLEDTATAAAAGIRIGSYLNCTPISDGVTSEVFRSADDRALKVITAHRNLEPHNPQREVQILRTLHPPCISLLEVFRDQEQRLVLVFPYMPLTLAHLLDDENTRLSRSQIQAIFSDTLKALQHIHDQGIVHRDVKPSAILLSSPSGPAFLSDFGTAWHPEFSIQSEPSSDKVLDIGTGPYRAPEVLFGNKSYGPPVDMWACGAMLAEAVQSPPKPLFESRPVHEDGNQLGLILSIFKTLGTPTEETWPEAKGFKVTPFELWTVFPTRPWDEIVPRVDRVYREALAALVRYDGKRASAAEALKLQCFIDHGE